MIIDRVLKKRRKEGNDRLTHGLHRAENLSDTIILYTEKGQCCGCGACQAICPMQAISMEVVDDFYYPMIDRSLCIKCRKCMKVCPLK